MVRHIQLSDASERFPQLAAAAPTAALGANLKSEAANPSVATGLSFQEQAKRAEQVLRESELKFREFIEIMPSMLWSAAPTGEPTHVNQRVLDYAGLRFEDFLNLGWKEFLHPEDFPETARAFYQAIQTGESYEAV